MLPVRNLGNMGDEMQENDVVPTKKIKTKSVELIPLYDLHYGSHQCRENDLKNIVKYIKGKSSCYTFLGGDLIECSIYGKMNAVHTQKIQITEQIQNIVEILKPIRNKILFSICGNHEHRIEKATGLDIMQIMADMLGIPYLGWEAHFALKLKGSMVRCYAHHGTSAAVTSGAKLNAIEKLHFRSPHAHLIFCGHTHFPFFSEKEIRYINSDCKMKRFTQYYISSGSLHESDGYATMKALPPIPTRLNKVKIRVENNAIIAESTKFV
jgi:predicted phosphodiesterase